MSDEWGTPKDFFIKLDKEFNFTLDPCANHGRLLKPQNQMLSINKHGNGLTQSWEGESVYVNPPYTGNALQKWARKCCSERWRAKVIVLLMPSRKTGTEWFHQFVLPYAEIRFIRGRLDFVPLEGQMRGKNPHSSILCIYRKL